ncbi:hypothetical protein HOO65_011082 [Ceratocystis lukuohia]|uniref:Peroxin 20 n=1 Tax=Ceratocystis lukuohia TaxID=2019550 RepID=A0ABR4MU51_9PEZI
MRIQDAAVSSSFAATPVLFQKEHTHMEEYKNMNNVNMPTVIHPSSLAMPKPNQSHTVEQPKSFASPAMAAHMYNQNMPMFQQQSVLMAPPNSFDVQMHMDRWMAANAQVVQASRQDEDLLSMEQDFSEVNDIMDQLAEDLSREININPPAEVHLPQNTLRGNADATLPTMDSAPDTDKETAIAEKQKVSDIAEVARQILDSVEHEGDEKWRKSSFFALMRDFRDGKKEVLDDKILDMKVDTTG